MAKQRHYILIFMMTFIMLSAVFLSGFHQHDVDEGAALSQTCDSCLLLKQTQLGALSSAILLLFVESRRIRGVIEPLYMFAALIFSSPSQPRAPPVV